MKPWVKILRAWPAFVFGTAVAAEVAWLRSEYRDAARWGLRMTQQRNRENQLADSAPALTVENERAMAAEVVRLQGDIAIRRQALWRLAAAPDRDGGMPESVDTFFNLAAMTSRLRGKAEAMHVAVKPDEYFGFAAYAHEGPPPAHTQVVQQQSQVSELILDCLFEAGPESLVSVRRERVEPGTAGDARPARDYFVLSPGMSLRQPGVIDTWAFRVEFRGGPPVLRDFLNGLLRASETLAVRSVDAVIPDGDRPGGNRKGGDTSGPLARSGPSQFAVIVEAVRPSVAPSSAKP